MPASKHAEAEFLQGARTLIENAAGLPELASVLAGYGYDPARLREGLALWTETEALARKWSKEFGEPYEATAELHKAWAAADSAYVKTLKVARVAFGDDPKAVSSLRLYGPRRQSLPGWLDQAGTFYAQLSSDGKLMERLARYGYGIGKLNAEIALMEAVRRPAQILARGAGPAQVAAAIRDKKIRELDAWVSELRSICRIAFYERPQELEKLGSMALNGQRRTRRAEMGIRTVADA